MPSVKLVPMTFGEFESYRKTTSENYAADVARATGVSLEDARKEAEETMKAQLPQAHETPDHYLIKIAKEDGTRIGSAWFGTKKTRDAQGRKRGYVFDIHIDENFQGQGYGEATMKELEKRARDIGCGQIALNVFGYNMRARALYEKLGYQSSAILMSKDLE